jgi:hypothetical protein
MRPRSRNRLTTRAVFTARKPQTLPMLEQLIDHINAHDRLHRTTFSEIADDP